MLTAALLRSYYTRALPHGRFVQKTAARRLRGEQRFHLAPEIFIVLAGFSQEGFPLPRLALPSRVI
jgi:hypothetical protein